MTDVTHIAADDIAAALTRGDLQSLIRNALADATKGSGELRDLIHDAVADAFAAGTAQPAAPEPVPAPDPGAADRAADAANVAAAEAERARWASMTPSELADAEQQVTRIRYRDAIVQLAATGGDLRDADPLGAGLDPAERADALTAAATVAATAGADKATVDKLRAGELPESRGDTLRRLLVALAGDRLDPADVDVLASLLVGQ